MTSPLHTPSLTRLFDRFVRLSLITLFLLWIVGSLWPQIQRMRQPRGLIAAQSLLQAGKVSEARTQFEKYLALQPAAPDQWTNVVLLCRAQKQNALEVEYAQRGVKACDAAPKPQRAELYRMLAMALTENGEAPPQPLARQAASQAYELDPDDIDSMNLLGYLIADNATDSAELLRAEGLITRALERIKGRVGIDQQINQIGIQDSLGWVKVKRGNATVGAEILSQAIDDMPQGDAIAQQYGTADLLKVMYYHLGAAYHQLNRIPEARHALDVALQYDPKYPPALAERSTLPPDPPVTVAPPSKP